MPMPLDLRGLAPGAQVQDPFLVLEVEQKSYGDKDCTVLTFGNATGRIPSAPFWDPTRVAGIARNDVVQVIGHVGTYRDRRQLNVTSIRPLPRGEVDPRGLLPSVGDVSRYWATLDRWRGEIRGARLRAVLALFFDDDEFRTRFEQCPASRGGHHAEIGGLLKHTCEVATIGRAICRTMPAAAINADLVLAGALLHDVGKVEAYTWEGAFALTECGALMEHVALGALMLDRRVRAFDESPCTDQELMLLHHLILSHHGTREHGAAIPPMTLEAEVLHYADNASAKSASMLDALGDAENFAGDELLSSRAIWQLDRRRAYRGRSDWGALAGGVGADD